MRDVAPINVSTAPLSTGAMQGKRLRALAGTLATILDKINADMQTALHSPDVEQRMQEVAMPPSPTTRQELDQFVRSEDTRWGRTIREAGLTAIRPSLRDRTSCVPASGARW